MVLIPCPMCRAEEQPSRGNEVRTCLYGVWVVYVPSWSSSLVPHQPSIGQPVKTVVCTKALAVGGMLVVVSEVPREVKWWWYHWGLFFSLLWVDSHCLGLKCSSRAYGGEDELVTGTDCCMVENWWWDSTLSMNSLSLIVMAWVPMAISSPNKIKLVIFCFIRLCCCKL